jgi:trk system potassium uptake protein TrkH
LINLKPVFYVAGILLLILSAAMFIPMVVDLFGGSPDWKVFAGSQIFTSFIGCLLIFTNREKTFRLSVRETFLMTALGWVALAAFGAMPLCLSSAHLSPAKGFFEAMSGITTSGLTTLSNLDSRPHGVLLWRALLHWLGGMAGLVSALAILPLLQVSGQQVFRAQSFDVAKVLPSAHQIAAWICVIYAALTLACVFLLRKGAGMGTFDAFCHAMTALSTGGFSTSNVSAGRFNSTAAELILMLFMLIGSLPFTLYLRMARGDASALFRDGQVRVFLCMIAASAWFLALYLLHGGLPFSEALRRGAFRAVALATTSGLTLNDDVLWGPGAAAAFFAMAFIGGCSGSTAGGVRVFRFQLLVSMMKLQIRKLIEPSGVFQAYYNKKSVDPEVQNAICVFFLAYIFLILAGGVLVMMTGIAFAPAFTSAFAAITNTGGAIATTGTPLAQFSALPSTPLWILSACMLLGRMEIFTLLVLFAPRFWRR